MALSKYFISSMVSFTSLFFLTKILGNRQMSQVSMFDYISSMALGSVAGEMAVLTTGGVKEPLFVMFLFTITSYFISYLTCKSIVLRRFFEGEAILMYQDGVFYAKNMLRAKLDMDELLAACRVNGYFDLEEIHTIYLEHNGELSILPRSIHRPVTPSDLNLNPSKECPLANVIIDGRIMYKNLETAGKDIHWLNEKLKEKNIKELRNIILATCDSELNQLYVYRKYNKKFSQDIFE